MVIPLYTHRHKTSHDLKSNSSPLRFLFVLSLSFSFTPSSLAPSPVLLPSLVLLLTVLLLNRPEERVCGVVGGGHYPSPIPFLGPRFRWSSCLTSDPFVSDILFGFFFTSGCLLLLPSSTSTRGLSLSLSLSRACSSTDVTFFQRLRHTPVRDSPCRPLSGLLDRPNDGFRGRETTMKPLL